MLWLSPSLPCLIKVAHKVIHSFFFASLQTEEFLLISKELKNLFAFLSKEKGRAYIVSVGIYDFMKKALNNNILNIDDEFDADEVMDDEVDEIEGIEDEEFDDGPEAIEDEFENY